jgi:hypothetical protein
MITFSDWLYFNVFLAFLPIALQFVILRMFAANKIGFKKAIYKPIENGGLYIFSATLALTSISTTILNNNLKTVNKLSSQDQIVLIILLFFSASIIGITSLQEHTGGTKNRNVIWYVGIAIFIAIATLLYSYKVLVI